LFLISIQIYILYYPMLNILTLCKTCGRTFEKEDR